MERKSQSLPSGTRIQGRVYTYTIDRVLGQGAFGITYLASTRMKGPLGEVTVQVALKEFFAKELDSRTQDGTVTARTEDGIAHKYARAFQRESENLSKMKHPGIVNVLEAFEAKGTYYYSMEYLSGGSLDDKVKGKGMLEEEALRLIKQVGEALTYMHGRKVMHLDLKPKNIMLKADGTPVIIDFGLSKQYDNNGEPESSSTIGMGTPGYAPLEQSTLASSRTFQPTLDVYALGATLFKMLTGETPPTSSEVFNGGFPSGDLRSRGVSEAVISAVEKGMAPQQSKRPGSIPEFLGLLHSEAPQGESSGDETIGIGTGTNPGTSKAAGTFFANLLPKISSAPWLKYAVAGVVSAVLVFLLAILLTRGKKPSTDTILINGEQVCEVELQGEAEEVDFTVEKNFDERWTYSGVTDWCTAKAVEGKITLSVAENVSSGSRTATIVFRKKGTSNKLAIISLTQMKKTSAADKTPGSLKVDSTPSGAAVWLDGRNTKKTTPAVLEGVSSGSHKIKLVLEGYKDYTGTVKIESGRRAELSRTLTEKPLQDQQEQTQGQSATQSATSGKINGHEWVDLGLSVKWATCNVGATKPEGSGNYYAWGETKPKSDYSWVTYKWCNGTANSLTKYNTSSDYGTVDNKTMLDRADDAARANWGGSWRMPTDAEWTELRTQCTWTWTSQNGVNGREVTGPNGNSIFLPAAGYRYGTSLNYVGSYGIYWSSSLDYTLYAWHVHFTSDYVDRDYGHRYYGQSVRPVTE